MSRARRRPRRSPGHTPGFWRKPAGREVLESVLALAVVAGIVAGLLALFGTSPAGIAAKEGGRTPVGATAGPSPGPAAGPEATSPPTSSMVPLLVLNNSRIHGLAARAAGVFRADGWPVRGTGNYRGRIPVTTIYYDGGDEAVARRFAARFPAVRRVLPRPFGLPGRGLTVVVTREFPA